MMEEELTGIERPFVRPTIELGPQTMRERMARALIRSFDTAPALPPGVGSVEYTHSLYLRAVDEMLMEMREPTENMKRSAFPITPHFSHAFLITPYFSHESLCIWTAMIDAALKEE
jgi:hypothetical protein